jgi:hypothetical protein
MADKLSFATRNVYRTRHDLVSEHQSHYRWFMARMRQHLIRIRSALHHAMIAIGIGAYLHDLPHHSRTQAVGIHGSRKCYVMTLTVFVGAAFWSLLGCHILVEKSNNPKTWILILDL